MLEGATGQTALTSTSALSQAVEGLTLPAAVPAPLQWPHELQRALTPHPLLLRHSVFKRELSHYPDKPWVSRLLIGINNGVSTGYKGPHYSLQANNLASAHPEVVNSELKKEVDPRRVLGPFPHCLLKDFRTSGVGVVQIKNGKWKMILHLSAPEGHTINDYITKDEFSLHYSTIDDAVALLVGLREELSWPNWTCKQPSAWSLYGPLSGNCWVCTGVVNIGHLPSLQPTFCP